MESTNERRSDVESQVTVDQAIEYAKTHGQAAAVTYLVENYVPPPMVERIMRRISDTKGTRILL